MLNENISFNTYLTLIPVCLGVGISCYHDNAFNLFGFLLAAASNFGFSTRAVVAKKMNQQYPDAIDDINMFSIISLEGMILLVPVTILFEGGSIAALLQPSALSTSMQLNFVNFCLLLLLNGIMFAIYNLASYIVLRKTDLITHSVLNAFRRVFIIVFTTMYFQSQLSMMNLMGIFIAVGGVVLFGYFKATDKKGSH
jgi:solute carrier family 35 protein E1